MMEIIGKVSRMDKKRLKVEIPWAVRSNFCEGERVKIVKFNEPLEDIEEWL